MLSRQASHALKALLELATQPLQWQSTHELATVQQLPEPMLEQLLLRLRRAGVLVARRGRLGGYRLARPAGEISMAAVLGALGDNLSSADMAKEPESAADRVTTTLARRLERVRQKALEELSLEDLLFDLRSAEASTDDDAGLLLG